MFRTAVSPDGQSCMCMGLRGKLLCFASFNTSFIFGDLVFEKSEVRALQIDSTFDWLGLGFGVWGLVFRV
jgi:hypothetical protein